MHRAVVVSTLPDLAHTSCSKWHAVELLVEGSRPTTCILCLVATFRVVHLTDVLRGKTYDEVSYDEAQDFDLQRSR